jgi:hypothetical protein
MSEELNVSYPTLRKNIDKLIEAVVHLQEEDERKINEILTDIEEGKIPSQKGVRLIKEMNGEL